MLTIEIPEHTKKNKQQIKDDILEMFIKEYNHKLTNNTMIVGKFRVLTTKHYELIKSALKTSNNVVISLVSNKETHKTKRLRELALKRIFGSSIYVLHTTTGNLITLSTRSPLHINKLLVGEDRYETFKRQSDTYGLGIKVEFIKRPEGSISASKVLNRIQDKDFFLNNTVLGEMFYSIYKNCKGE